MRHELNYAPFPADVFVEFVSCRYFAVLLCVVSAGKEEYRWWHDESGGVCLIVIGCGASQS